MTPLVLVRRVEALLLLLLAASLALLDDVSLVLDLLPVAFAMVLLLQNLKARPKPEITRQIDDLLLHGLRVHSSYLSANKMRGAWPKTKELALAQYETEKWVDRTRVLLKPYPEFAGIFESRQGVTPADEVANRIRRLHEIKSLLTVSQRVGLRRD